VICLPADMKLYRVAAHVADLRARRVVVCQAREPVGIVSDPTSRASSRWRERTQRAPVCERPNNSQPCGVPRGHTGRHRHVVERDLRHVARRVAGRSMSRRCEMAIARPIRAVRYGRNSPSRHVAC
jgi:hypothetical protein